MLCLPWADEPGLWKAVEQGMGSEPVSRTPPWPLLQFLPLGSYLELLGPLDDRL